MVIPPFYTRALEVLRHTQKTSVTAIWRYGGNAITPPPRRGLTVFVRAITSGSYRYGPNVMVIEAGDINADSSAGSDDQVVNTETPAFPQQPKRPTILAARLPSRVPGVRPDQSGTQLERMPCSCTFD